MVSNSEQLVATFIGVYGFNGYPGYDASAAPGELIWGRASFVGAGWAYAALACKRSIEHAPCTCKTGKRGPVLSPDYHGTDAGLWSLVWYLPLDVIKMGLMRLLVKVPDLAAKEHAMVMHAGFSTAFHQAGPNIVRRVSVIRIV